MSQIICWLPDEVGITSGGDVGGDEQTGECYNARYFSAQVPLGVIDVHCYVTGPTADNPDEPWSFRWAATYTLRARLDAPMGAAGEWSDAVYHRHTDDLQAVNQREAEAAALRALAWLEPDYLTREGRPDVRELFPN